jgi:hypothetical protein
VTADEAGPCVGYESREFLSRLTFHTSNVSHNGTAFQGGQHLLRKVQHLADRCTQDDEIGVFNRLGQDHRGRVNGSSLHTFFNGGLPPDIPDNLRRKTALPDGQSHGAAQQTNAYQRYFLPVHAVKIKEWPAVKSAM